MKVFQRHPLPWKYVPDACRCGNGGSIDSIDDANGECVATSYWSRTGLDALWDFYLALTPEQQRELGDGEPIPSTDEGDDE